jgi:hypothetical protein
MSEEPEDPLVVRSASRHGVNEADALHAFRNPIRIFLVGEDMTMVIGADTAGRLLEIGVVESREDSKLVIVHAMLAREKFLKE